MDRVDKKIKNMLNDYSKLPNNYDKQIENMIEKIEFKKESCYKKERLNFKKIIIEIVTLIITTATIGVFANSVLFNKKIISYKDSIESNKIESLEMTEYSEIKGLKYKIIDNENDYNLIQSVYEEIPNVDFKNEFLILVEFNYGANDGLNIENIDKNEDVTTITFGNSLLVPSKTFENKLCVTISNDYKSQNYKFEIIPGTNSISNYGLTPLENLKANYYEDVAKNENVIILDEFANTSISNKIKLDDFLEKTANNENTAIRLVKKASDLDINEKNFAFRVYDLIYENGEYYYFSLNMKNDNTHDEPYSIKGINEIKENFNSKTNMYEYSLIYCDDYGNDCSSIFTMIIYN
jgi:hypothetical protein